MLYITFGEVMGFSGFLATGLAFAVRPNDGIARQGRRVGFHCCLSKWHWSVSGLLLLWALQFVEVMGFRFFGAPRFWLAPSVRMVALVSKGVWAPFTAVVPKDVGRKSFAF